jgi:hypothetical protein
MVTPAFLHTEEESASTRHIVGYVSHVLIRIIFGKTGIEGLQHHFNNQSKVIDWLSRLLPWCEERIVSPIKVIKKRIFKLSQIDPKLAWR